MAMTDKDIQKLKGVFATKEGLDDFKEEIMQGFQTWKSESCDRIDPILMKVQDNLGERTIMNKQLDGHEDLLQKLNAL